MTTSWVRGATRSSGTDSLGLGLRRLTSAAPIETPDRRLPQGILISIGAVAVVVAAFAASAVPQAHLALRYAVLTGTVFVFTAAAGRWAVPTWMALIGYLVFDGFLVNRMGELSWNGRDDIARLLTLSAAVIFGRLAGDSYRLYRLFARAQAERRSSRPAMASFNQLKEEGHDA